MITRRRFLGSILLGFSTTVLGVPSGFMSPASGAVRTAVLPPSGRLTDEGWRTLRAVVDAIIPATPQAVSASGAGVLHYLDRALAGLYADFLPTYREIVALLKFPPPGFRRPLWLSGAAGITAAVEWFEREHPDRFALVRRHTLEGYFSAPRHGGNVDCLGWRVVRLRSHVLPWEEVQGR